MADGLCTEDTVRSNLIEKTLLKNYNANLKCVQTICANDHRLSANVKSFYIDSDSGKLCSSKEASRNKHDEDLGFLASPSPGDEDCRKKRCSDRYDSSESSDSGVAVLSCTDCSNYSGGSTASSDITDPGSPFSTASSHSDDSQSHQQPPTMPPNLSAHHPPWPWSGGESPPLKRTTGSATTASDKTAPTTKRLKTEPSTKSLPTTNTTTIKDSNSNHVVDLKKAPIKLQKVQQGKITEYFKSQMKPSMGGQLKKDELQKFFNIIDAPKVILNGTKFHPEIYNVRSLTSKVKKITSVITVPRNILPAAPKVQSTPIVKLSPLRLPHNTDFTYLKKLPENMMKISKFTNGNNNNKRINGTNLKLTSSSVVPSKLNGSTIHINNNNNFKSLSVETAVPTVTVPSAKPKQHDSVPQKKSPITPPESNSNSCSSTSSTSLQDGKSDSDSGVSIRDLLSVTISGANTTLASSTAEPQKSPILSQPKTIRFPAKQIERKDQRRTDTGDSGLCRWSECQAQFDTGGALLEHLQIQHVISQAKEEHYVCLWVGCKVHGRTSCSRSWLERHVLSHAGNKPFRCIVDGCGFRFSSQQALERHVNSHFNGSENGSNGTRKSLESTQAKLFKRNGKKLRYRRQPWSARMFDYFDAGIMEGLQHRLVKMTEKRTLGDIAKAPGDSITLHSRIVARRVEPNGTRKVLLSWTPPDIIDDEWTLESEVQTTRTVSIPTLEPSSMNVLNETLFPARSNDFSSSSSSSTCSSSLSSFSSPYSSCSSTPCRKNRRKQSAVKTT